ncbi:hypothetical protein Bca4012_066628 [Brassica carinata]
MKRNHLCRYKKKRLMSSYCCIYFLRMKQETKCGYWIWQGRGRRAEVLERWPEKDTFRECQCHKRDPMAHRV